MILVMTALRLVPLPIHSALEMMLGMALMAVPFVIGASVAGIVAGVVVGALVVGLALQGLDAGGRPALPVSAHHAADYGLALGMAGGALVLTIDDPAVATVFGVAAVAQLTLNLTTRYSQR